MQEHIRRAHPEHYISKLPATEESFLLMINTPPSERPPSQQNAGPAHGGLTGSPAHVNGPPPPPPMHNSMSHASIHQNQTKPFVHDIKHGAPGIPRNADEFVAGSALPAASAAAALAQLHTHKLDRDWDEGVSLSMGDVSVLSLYFCFPFILVQVSLANNVFFSFLFSILSGLDFRYRKRPLTALLC